MSPITAAIKPYGKQKAPAQYNPGKEDVERAAIMRGIRPIKCETHTAAYTVTAADELVVMDTTAGPLSVTLPMASSMHVTMPATTLRCCPTPSGVSGIDARYLRWRPAWRCVPSRADTESTSEECCRGRDGTGRRKPPALRDNVHTYNTI